MKERKRPRQGIKDNIPREIESKPAMKKTRANPVEGIEKKKENGKKRGMKERAGIRSRDSKGILSAITFTFVFFSLAYNIPFLSLSYILWHFLFILGSFPFILLPLGPGRTCAGRLSSATLFARKLRPDRAERENEREKEGMKRKECQRNNER